MRYGLNRITWTWKLVERIDQLRAEGLSWSQIADEHFPHITRRSLCSGYHQARRQDATEHLLSNPNNAERLAASIRQVRTEEDDRADPATTI